LIAAKNALAIAPAEARAQLRDIEASDQMPRSMDAGVCLRALDQGIFKPI
jgi:hypothetical protein